MTGVAGVPAAGHAMEELEVGLVPAREESLARAAALRRRVVTAMTAWLLWWCGENGVIGVAAL